MYDEKNRGGLRSMFGSKVRVRVILISSYLVFAAYSFHYVIASACA